MTSPHSQDQPENTYIIDVESAAEMARLLDQDKMLTQAMGGLFPERADLSGIFDVLDIACGPGGWVHEVAHAYPEMEVTGIDISQRMVTYARTHAQVRKLPNAHFRLMDALKPLDFPAASFDLVNARALAGFMRPQAWPTFLQECKRILRPGGIIRLVEGEIGPTNQLAVETLYSLLTRALTSAGLSSSPTGHFIGIHAVMGRMLRDASFQEVQSKAAVNDHSFGMSGYDVTRQDLMLMFKLIQPFLVQTQVATREEVEQLYEQAIGEIHSEDFCAVAYWLTVWGHKPHME